MHEVLLTARQNVKNCGQKFLELNSLNVHDRYLHFIVFHCTKNEVFFSKWDQIRKNLRIWSLLLKKSLMENFIFCAVFDFLKFNNNQTEYFAFYSWVFCLVDDNGVATRSCNRKLRLPFRKSKLGMQSLSYIVPSTWNKLPNNLKTATSVNYFKYDIKKYFLKGTLMQIWKSPYIFVFL